MELFDEYTLSTLAAKKLIVFWIKWRQPIVTLIENLNVHKESALIGVFGPNVKKCIEDNRLVEKFTAIVDFDESSDVVDKLSTNTDAIQLPNLTQLADRIVEAFGRAKVKLITNDPLCIYTIGLINEKHGLNGPTTRMQEHLHDKILTKYRAEQNDINVIPYYYLTKDKIAMGKLNPDGLVDKVKGTVGEFPLFAKPSHGVGGKGAMTLSNEADLHHLLETLDEGDSYLIEKLMTGTELWIMYIILADGTPILHQASALPYATLSDSLKTGKPMAFISYHPDDLETSFPGLKTFSRRVVDAFQPPAPHYFMIQAWQTNYGSYVLTELAYRTPGMRGSSESWWATGISSDTAFVSCHLNPNYEADVDPDWPKGMHAAQVWYFTRPGWLKAKQHVPIEKLQCSAEVRWYKDKGARYEGAKWLWDNVMSVHLHQTSAKAVEMDAKWLFDNYTLDYSDTDQLSDVNK